MKLGKAAGAAAGLTNTVYGDKDDRIVSTTGTKRTDRYTGIMGCLNRSNGNRIRVAESSLSSEFKTIMIVSIYHPSTSKGGLYEIESFGHWKPFNKNFFGASGDALLGLCGFCWGGITRKDRQHCSLGRA